jgi:hypothetical protein
LYGISQESQEEGEEAMKTGMSGANRRGMVNARQNKDMSDLRKMKKAFYMEGKGSRKTIKKKEESNAKRARIRYGDNGVYQYTGGESRKKWMNWRTK